MSGIDETPATQQQKHPYNRDVKVENDKNKLNPDSFMRLFLTQLTHQNPMHPADSNSILQQMAEISSISASKDMQQSIADMKKSMNLALGRNEYVNATQMIGKKAVVPWPQSQLIKGEGMSGSVYIPPSMVSKSVAADIKLTIRDRNDNIVKEIDLGASDKPGMIDFHWDGLKDKDPAHPELPQEEYPAGTEYKISATAKVNGETKKVDCLGAFRIKSVALNPQNGDVLLNAEGPGGLRLDEVYKILGG
ncbi:MAG: flagellar hook assembly protein FlgD [Gammaproteobacteria bacterium]